MNKYQQSYEYIEGFIKLYPTHKLDEEHLANIKELVDLVGKTTLEKIKEDLEMFSIIKKTWSKLHCDTFTGAIIKLQNISFNDWSELSEYLLKEAKQ